MTFTRKRGKGCLKICYLFANSFFKNKMIYCSFFVDEGSGGHKTVISCGYHKHMTLKWFKITTNSIIKRSSFLFKINSDVF